MPSTNRQQTKDGRVYYEIRCHVTHDKILKTRWYVPEGWSQRAIDRELQKVSAEFERACAAGEVKSRADLKAQREAEERAAAAILTVRQYGERVFMPAKTVTCSENTRSSFQSMLDHHVYPALGDTKMPEVTSAQISALLLDFQTKGYAHASCVKLHTIISLLFKQAYLGDIISKNPMDKVERPKPRKDEMKSAEVESFTAEELRYILSCLDGEPLKWRAFLHLMLDTGARRGEICGLQWKYVDFAENTVTIAQTLNYTKGKGVYLDTPKNGKQRTVDVSHGVMALLRELRQEQAANGLSAFVFTQEDSSEPMHPQSPTRYMETFSKHYGVEHLHPYKLRHSFASVAITSGADVASISEILGHSDKAVTLRVYAHADRESRKRAGDIFREALENRHKKTGQAQ